MPIFGESERGFKVWPLVIFALFAVGYYFLNSETVPLTGRKQVVGMSPDQEAHLGLQSYQTILQQSEVLSSGPQVELVRRIGRRLAKVTDDPRFEWEFNVIQSPEANAFCLPGGKVAVYTGILPVAENENGLAVIMGHEIAHAVARHGAERVAHQQLAQFGQLAMGMASSEMDPQARQLVMGAFGVGAQFGVLLPFSREHESEADYMGLIYLAKSCFDPQEAPALWKRMSAAKGGRAGPPQFMSTHPADTTRIEQFKKWMPEAMKIRAQHCP